MSSSDSHTDGKIYPECCKDLAESHTELEAKCPRLSDSGHVSLASNHSGSTIKPFAPNKHFIRDTNQQILVLQGRTLVAVPDKLSKCGGDPQIFNPMEMSSFMYQLYPKRKASGSTANYIVLAVCKGKLYLCCNRVKKPKRPSLVLKKIKDLSSLSREKLLPFTFLKQKSGSYFTLESAANPGYFVCTCSIPRQPVGVTKELGKQKNTHFEFVNANVDLSEMEA